MTLFFSDFWGIPESEETETEPGMLCDEDLHQNLQKPPKRKTLRLCAYCNQDMTPSEEMTWSRDDVISHVQVCNVLSKMISCSVCKKDMAKLTISERRTHVETCEQKQADAFFKP